MKYVSNDRGALPVLLAILVVALIAVVGVAVYNVSKSHQKVAQTETMSPSPSSSEAPASPTVTPVPPSYLDIKELGVKIRLTDDIKDAVYSYDTQTPQRVRISSSSLIAADPNCKPGAQGPLGSIGKTTEPNQPIGMLSPNNETVFKFGDYYYFYQTPQSACSTRQEVLDLASKQMRSFKQAFQTVQPD